MAFVHLHTHIYSLLDSMLKIKPMIAKAKADGQTAIAITDHGTCYGIPDFVSACDKEGIKPIIGCEFYEAPSSRFTHDTGDDKYNHLIILVKNETGYKNFCRLVTKANTEGFYYKPRIDFELLEKYHEGLICLSACLAGRIPKDILSGNEKKTEEDILRYKKIFGDDFYLEIQNHGIKEEMTVALELVRLSRVLGVELVCTNDCHYLDSSDAEAHEWLMCLQTKKTLADSDRMIYEGDYSFKSEAEMRSLFPSLPDAFDNTVKIADKCNFRFKYAKTPADYRMPKVVIPEEYGSDYYAYLESEAWKGYEKRYPEGHPYRDSAKPRLEYELSVIKQMGFAEYFLDTRKTILWSRRHGILVGPGRGSGAGSVLNYCLTITDIEPLKYGLIFERFLNPERVSMPDIDVDYDYAHKDEVIASEAASNGHENFCKIETLGSMFAKSVIRDCARVAGYEASVGNTLAKMIPNDASITLDEAYAMNPDIGQYLATDEKIRKLWDIAKKLEGLKKSAGTHACGHIPTPVPCEELFPCRVDEETGYLVCQYDMSAAEHLGNLKKDLLMLRNLTVIDKCIKAVKVHYDIDIPLWNDEILYDDAALKLFWTGDTDGVFQFESEGMRKFMKELQPDTFEDIIAGVSLYRPGPMDYIPDYIRGKHNADEIKYLCPELKHILAPTYGQIVYQEQVMQICTDLAGFSRARADSVRKAMGKKKLDVMLAEKENFINGSKENDIPGCAQNGIAREVAEEIWNRMEKFASYAFNKSHAACYAAISMQTAYLKAHYPAEFMSGLLTSVSDNTDKLVPYINVCAKNGITIHKPDVNTSLTDFKANPDGSITYGLSSVKGIGDAVIKAIMDERENGRFEGMRDLVSRVPIVSKKILEQLTKAGAFDSFGYSRRTYLENIDRVVDSRNKEAKNSIPGQLSMFDFFEPEAKSDSFINVTEMPKKDLLEFEKEVTGYYLSGHPLTEYMKNFSKKIIPLKDLISTEDYISPYPENQEVRCAVCVKNFRKIYTKKDGKPMCSATLDDPSASIRAVCFPKAYAELKEVLEDDALLIVSGTVTEDMNDGTSQFIINNAYPIDKAPISAYLRIKDMGMTEALDLIIQRSDEGEDEVSIVVVPDGGNRQIKKYPYRINFAGIDAQCRALIGDENVAAVIR